MAEFSLRASFSLLRQKYLAAISVQQYALLQVFFYVPIFFFEKLALWFVDFAEILCKGSQDYEKFLSKVSTKNGEEYMEWAEREKENSEKKSNIFGVMAMGLEACDSL